MKKIRKVLPVMTFVLGVGTGIMMIVLLSFSKSPVPAESPQVLRPIDTTEAQTLLRHYLSSTTIPAMPVKGFFLDMQQLDAMNRLSRENTTLTGFRIYLGKDANNVVVGIVVGVNNRGSDAVSNTIYKTESSRSGPCPPVCDITSPITR